MQTAFPLPRYNMNKIVALILQKDQRVLRIISQIMAARALDTGPQHFIDVMGEIAINSNIGAKEVADVNELISIANKCNPFTKINAIVSEYDYDAIVNDPIVEHIASLAQIRTTINNHANDEDKAKIFTNMPMSSDGVGIYATASGKVVLVGSYPSAFAVSAHAGKFNNIVNHVLKTLYNMIDMTAEWRKDATESEIVQTVINILMTMVGKYCDALSAIAGTSYISNIELAEFVFEKSETFNGTVYQPSLKLQNNQFTDPVLIFNFGANEYATFANRMQPAPHVEPAAE